VLKIAIVGAGLGGLSVAIGLARAGHEIEIFEKAPELREVGAGMTLWSNATQALRYLGVLDTCLAQSASLQHLQLRFAAGKAFMEIPVEEFATPAVAMRRADLQSILVRALPSGRLHLDSACTGICEDAAGIRLRFARESEFAQDPFDIAIIADGARSVLRDTVVEARPLRYQGYVVWRGIAYLAEGEWPAGLLTETWGTGRRFGCLPGHAGQVYWYATENRTRSTLAEPWSQPIPVRFAKEELLERFAGWHEPIARILNATPNGTSVCNPAFDRSISRGWSRGRMVVLGDAVHPSSPNLGQGGCMALEDAAILSRVLASCAPQDYASAFATYEKLRRGRVRNIVRRSRMIGRLTQFEGPRKMWLRNRVARHMPGKWFTATSRSIQSYGVEDVAI
jgi:2-polyprenyl-6-methoxyphenol hydroxylase-like FAD-dependent oxidoreductase